MARSTTLPAPFLGVNQTIPVAALQSPYCENLLNFNTTAQGATLRNGDKGFFHNPIANLSTTKVFGAYGDESLFAVVYDTATTENKVYDIETSTLVYTSAASGQGVFYPQFFNKNLFFFSTTAAYSPGIKWDGSAWAVIGYTGTGLAPVGGGNVYKGRNYIIQNGEPAYWYSNLAAITGALTKVDIGEFLENNSTLSNIVKITLSEGREAEEFQAFIFANGEILFYRGSYPNSSNWGLVGTAKVGSLVSVKRSTFKYQGDAIVLTESGIVSLRELFLRGSQEAVSLSINTRVEDTWKTLIAAIRTDFGVPSGPITDSIQGIWDEKNSRIYIVLPAGYADVNFTSLSTPGNFFFVYDALRQSWSFHSSARAIPVFTELIYYKNKKILAPNTAEIVTLEKEGASGYQDRNAADDDDVDFNYGFISAPIPFPKTASFDASQIEPIIQSDLYLNTNWNFVADLGRQTTGNQTTTAGTDVAKPAVNVGLHDSTFTQVKMSGSTTSSKTVGLTLYSYNVWYDSGAEASR